ncbi:putative integral membrane protein conserved region-domain-containing protein [Syncephalastrum racemosum]|uniref:Putative integral membrane protein conserved region-domain-containing protein n=1 Tax=Syncephalastrum racemosum TaxID=13706 RepID=A0A1X2HWA7_SYNRA|nr:putative integral membrane protein conserved region-domain-containing protein [Syncephalastrum racemosum]
MVSLFTFAVIYISGGLTFLPVVLLLAYWFASAEVYSSDKDPVSRYPKEHYHETDFESGKKGWIRLTNHAQSALGNGNGSKLMAGLQAYMTNNNGKDVKRPKDLVYGVLKHGTLFLYESENQLDCKMIIPVHDYTVSIFPEGMRDHELFNRSTAIRLKPKHGRAQTMLDEQKKPHMQTIVKSKTDSELDVNGPDEHWALDKDIYLMCARPIDKEDWYFSLIYASGFMADDPFTHIETIDATRFDTHAMQDLITTLQKDPDHRHVQWLNAILGRIFLGLYKTDKVQRLFQEKITKKAKKMKRPAFLDEIHVQTVKFGQNIPYFTQPKLLGLTMDGALEAEAQVDYAGGLCVVIETDFHWTYSSRMKPIRVHLVLSVTLKQLVGKMKFKIKAPPTNRYWLGFYEMPKLELAIKPIVSDKQIKLNMVTNAIESKIREVLAETMVLPNMDDFTFCDTDGKGGIFGDRVPRSDDASDTSSLEIKGEQLTPTVNKPSSVKSTPPPAKPARRRSGSEQPIEANNLLSHPIQTEVSKSSPDLLSARSRPSTDDDASQTRETASATSAEALGGDHSSDSSSSQSIPSSSQSSGRWAGLAMRRKKARSSVDGESISEREDEESSKPSTDANSTARSIGASSRKGFFSKLGDDAKRGSLYQKAETFWQRGKEMTRELRDKEDKSGRRLSIARRFSQSSAVSESREQLEGHKPRATEEREEEEEKQVTEALVAPEKDSKPIEAIASDKPTGQEPVAQEEPKADETQRGRPATTPPLPPRTRAGSTASTASDTERISRNRPLPPPPASAPPTAPPPPPPPRKADTKPPLPPRIIKEDESRESKPPVPPRPSNTTQDARPLESAEC